MEDWSEQPAFSKAIGKLVEKAPESALQNIAAIAVKDLKYVSARGCSCKRCLGLHA